MRSSLLGVVVIAAMGGLLFGFDVAVISGAKTALETVYDLDSFWLGFTFAAALIGTIVGAMTTGKPSDAYGRRTTLLIIAVLYFVSAVGSALAWDWYSFVAFRFIGGIGVGGASVVSPLYIAEIAPARMRGRLVAITQFNIVLGILLAYLSNYLVAQCEFGATEWRWMFGIEAFPALAFFFLLFLTPRSPRWLLGRQRVDEARSVLERFGADSGDVDGEIAAIQHSLALDRHSVTEPLFTKAYAKPIMLAVAIAMFNQLSGINALMYYAPTIFEMAGAGKNAALLQSVGVGLMNLVFTMIAMSIIDHFGRRKLMIVGSIGYIVSLATTAWAFYTYGEQFKHSDPTATMTRGGLIVLIALLVFIASHAFGQGAVIWVFISEIFPNRVRARGQALGCFTHWFMAALVSLTFPMIAEWSGGHVFAFYAVMMVLQLVWVLTKMPETKGVALEQIQERLGIE